MLNSMPKFIFFFFLVTQSLFANPKTADRYFEAGLFDRAAPLYAQMGNRLREVECLYLAKKAQAVVEKLEGNNPQGKEKYYLALAYQDLGREEKMREAEESYLKDPAAEPEKSLAFRTHLYLKKAGEFAQEKRWEEGEKLLSELNPTAEVLTHLIQFKEARSAPREEITALRRSLLSLNPANEKEAAWQAAAEFELYSFQDYLLGHKEALRHLKDYVKKYTSSPYAIVGWYLIGLDLKRDRKTEAGRRIHAKNLELSAEAFHSAENLYQTLSSRLSTDEKAYFSQIEKRATLERARTLIEIADEASGAKKHIYLMYAADVLSPLSEPEGRLLLAEVHRLNHDLPSALIELDKLEKEFRDKKIDKDFYFAKTLLEKGKLLYDSGKSQEAIALLEEGEKRAPLETLTADELLEARIAKGLCLKDLNQLEGAMLVLSDVVNSDFISSLRVKAMYFRALIYESQGRPELARRQLEAALSKGGEWAAKAKDKWTKEYHE